MILCLIFSAASVSAAEINNTDQELTTSSNIDTLCANVEEDANNTNTLGVSEDTVLTAGVNDSGSILKANEATGSYSDLAKLIRLSSGELVVYQNYTYNPTVDSVYVNGFNITKPITIDFQGEYTLDIGNSQINIQSDNVILKNINFKGNNFKYLIYSTMNNVVLENCTFKNIDLSTTTTALIGGKGQITINNSKLYNIITKYPSSTDRTPNYNVLLSFYGDCIISNSLFDNTWVLSSNNLIVKNSTFKNFDNSKIYAAPQFIPYGGGNLSVYDSNFINVGYISDGTRANCYFDNISVYNSSNTHTVNGRFSLFSIKDYYTVTNSYFEGNEESLFGGGALVYNSTFYSNDLKNVIYPSAGGGWYDSVTLDNCTFKENKIIDLVTTSGIYATNHVEQYQFNGVVISNNTFDNNEMRIFLASNQNSLLNNTFINNIPYYFNGNDFLIIASQRSYKDGKTTYYQTASKSVISNNTFINNHGFYRAPIVINKGSSYTEGNIFTNNINTAGVVSTIVKDVTTSYTPYYILYASPDGRNGGGTNDEDRCSLKYAVENIMPSGLISLKPGTYTDITSRVTLNANLVGESETDVIISKGSFTLKNPNQIIKNIVFDNTQSPFQILVPHITFDNITIVNNVKSNYIIYHDGYSYDFDHTFKNITIKDSTLSGFYQTYTQYVSMDYTLEDFTVIRTTFSGHAFHFGGSAGGINIKNFNFKDCTFNQNVFYMENPTYGPCKGYYFKVSNINFNHCTMGVNVFATNVIDYNFLVLDNVNIVNHSSITKYLVSGYKFNCSNVEIKDLDNTMQGIFNCIDDSYNEEETSFNIRDILLENVKSNNLVSGKIQGWHELENLTLTNVSMKTLSEGNNIVISSFNDLNFTNTTFTTNIVTTLPTGSVISGSDFYNVSGHIIVNGKSVSVLNSNFKYCNNSLLNGSVFYVKTGSDYFKVRDCLFLNNSADYGGAIYIEPNVQRTGFYNTNFTNNTAKKITNGSITDTVSEDNELHYNLSDYNTGGAIYFKEVKDTTTGVYSTHIVTHDAYTWSTINMTSFYFNNIHGNLTELVSDVYVVLHPEAWIHDGYTSNGNAKSWLNAGSLYNAFLVAGDDCVFHFVNSSEVHDFTSMPWITTTNFDKDSMIPLSDDPDSMSDNLTFNGNNTTIAHLGLHVLSNRSVTMYNLTFKDYPGSAVIVDGEGCIFENCSFINNGNETTVYGAGIQINANNTRLVNVNFNNNKASSTDSMGGALYINASRVDVINCTFNSNGAGSGSHIYITPDNEFINLMGNNFTYGVAVSDGSHSGVVLNSGTMITLVDSIFENNTGLTALLVDGLFLYCSIVDNTFKNNTGADDAGAFYLKADVDQKVPMSIYNNNFIGNNASGLGGALFIDYSNTPESLIFENATFSGNNASSLGGGLYINCSDIKLDNFDFTGNNATRGGAVYVNASNIVFNVADFTGNNATRGGAAYLNANGTVFNNCTFISNMANFTESYGSAIYVADNTTVTVNSCRFDKNYVYGGNGTLSRADLSYDGILPGIGKDTVWTKDPYQQYAHNRTAVTIYYKMVYVSLQDRGQGYSNATATTMEKALKGILPDGVIIICDDEYTWNETTLNMLHDLNLVNVTFQGLTSKTSIKRTNDQQNEKYLFILAIFEDHFKISVMLFFCRYSLSLILSCLIL